MPQHVIHFPATDPATATRGQSVPPPPLTKGAHRVGTGRGEGRRGGRKWEKKNKKMSNEETVESRKQQRPRGRRGGEEEGENKQREGRKQQEDKVIFSFPPRKRARVHVAFLYC